MKVKRDRKQKKPLLKVKKDTKTGESSLKKAVKNVKQLLLKKKDIIKKEIKNEVETKPSQVIKKSKSLIKIKGVKGIKGIKGVKKEDKQPIIKADRPKIKKERGVIYIGHVPHGFYEEEMKGYFSQFGKVTKVRLSRSSKSGRSKGYAFVEFLMPEVAKIAAESMNNYLMNGRLVKAEYIPPEKQHKHYFKGPEWSASRFPTLINRKKTISKHNAPKPNKTHKHTVKKSIKYLSKISEKLKQQGIDLGMKIGDVKL